MTQQTLKFENKTIKATVVTPQTKSKTRKSGLDEALEDVKAGRVYKAKNVDDLFKQILG